MKKIKQVLFSLGNTVFIVMVLSINLLTGCTDKSGAERVLKAHGYTHIVITGWRPLSGSEKDFYCTGFEATSPSGRRVTGTVTSGLILKGNTIRLD